MNRGFHIYMHLNHGIYTYTQVHIIVGIGYFMSNLGKNKAGVMADVAASPNDPIFINHHTMIDCFLEEWLQGHPDADYPNIPSTLEEHHSSVLSTLQT